MHIYQILPYVLSTSFPTHPKPLTWDKKPFQSRRVHFFWHYETFLLFSALWDWFFPEIFHCSSHQFLIFCNRMDVQKISKRPPFYIFRHYATYRKLQKNSKKNRNFFFWIFNFLRELLLSPVVEKVVLVFLSLRYGADLGRSRLVQFFNLSDAFSTKKSFKINFIAARLSGLSSCCQWYKISKPGQWST